MIFDWPAALVPSTVSVRPPRKTAALNTSLDETTQVVPVMRPPFGLTLEFESLSGSEVLAYRAVLASFEGRANLVRVPLFDVYAAASPDTGFGLSSFSDGSAFSDGARWLIDDLDGVLVTGVQGARTITADFGDYGQLLEAGQYFGLGDRPYIATWVNWVGNVATIRFSPSLREDYTNQPLRLRPVMIAGLVEDDGGEHVLDRGLLTSPTLDLVERFDEPLS